MNYNDKNPKHRKELEDYLTRPDQRLEKQPGYNYEKDPNLLRRIKYLTETFDGADFGNSLDKAIANEDKELAKLGREPKNILQRQYPKEATTGQVDYLKNNLNKMKEQNKPSVEELVKKRSLNKRGLNTVVYDGSKPTHKPTYRRGDAKIIIDELKKEQRKKNPILNIDPLPNPISIPEAVEPVQPPTREQLLKEIENHSINSKKNNDMTGIFGTTEYYLRKRGI